MKVYITTNGDSSVGIQGEHITIDWPGLEDLIGDDSEGPSIREALAETFGGLLAERVTVTYEDECPECGAAGRTPELTCPNPKCPENVAWGQEPCPNCGGGGIDTITDDVGSTIVQTCEDCLGTGRL